MGKPIDKTKHCRDKNEENLPGRPKYKNLYPWRDPYRGIHKGGRPKAASPYGWLCEGWVHQWNANGTLAREWNTNGTRTPKMVHGWNADPLIYNIAGDRQGLITMTPARDPTQDSENGSSPGNWPEPRQKLVWASTRTSTGTGNYHAVLVPVPVAAPVATIQIKREPAWRRGGVAAWQEPSL